MNVLIIDGNQLFRILIPTKKQLKEEFPNYDIEMILDNLIKADAIFAGKILE